MSDFVGHYACVACDSSDGLALYDNGDSFSANCFSCNKPFTHNQLAKTELGHDLGLEKIQWSKSQAEDKPLKGTPRLAKQRKEIISVDEMQGIIDLGAFDTTKYRKLSMKVNEKYNVISHYRDKQVHKRYYPITEKGITVGYKIRELPKTFFSTGRNDNFCDLFGQSLTPKGGKYLLIVGGEEDALAAYEMLRMEQSNRGRSDLPPVTVVSPTTGETSCQKQLQHNYEWINQFENIILMFDNDAAGYEAAEKAIAVLPIGKVKVANLPLKDPSDMKQAGRETEFVRQFYDAKKVSPAGVFGSDTLYSAILEKAGTPKVPFPPFLSKLNSITAGGIPLKSIVNVIAGSGIGKTTWMNELVLHWVFNSPYKVGIISLEADCAEYGNCVLSAHLGNKLSLIEDPIELRRYLESDHVKQEADRLFINDDGEPRFYLVDDRGDLGGLQAKIEQLIISCGVQLIVIDPLSDIMAGMDNSEQELFMAWQKKMIKAYDVSFFNVNHTRKGKDNATAASRGAEISEEDIIGSSTIYKSASMNITLVRDKHAEDDVDRNTTKVTLTKNRSTGTTGPAGSVYYDNRTHKLFDSVAYWAEKAQDFDIPDEAYAHDPALVELDDKPF